MVTMCNPIINPANISPEYYMSTQGLSPSTKLHTPIKVWFIKTRQRPENKKRYHLRITNTRLALRRANVRVVHLGRELETGQRLGEVSLQRADHDKHQGLGIAAERELEEVGKLVGISELHTTKCKVHRHTLLLR